MHITSRSVSRLRSRLRRPPLARVLLLVGTLLVMATATTPPASAAEAGVNLVGNTASQEPSIRALGVHWVRMFATWPDLEPTKGSFSPFWLSYYEETFRSLPSGTKVLLDVVDTPSWETGSSNDQTPPANPQEYAAFVVRQLASVIQIGLPSPLASFTACTSR